MSTGRLPSTHQILVRWMLGSALVSWRYVWQTLPLHRTDREGGPEDLPPDLPPGVVGDDAQLAEDGVGRMFHRRFSVHVVDAWTSPADLMGGIARDFKHFVPSEVVDIATDHSDRRPLRVGDEFVVEMPGPWNGPVRVVHVDDSCLHLLTLRGHLEAGQIVFRARHEGDHLLVFEIEAWARPATPLVHLLYARVRLAKEIQLNMWVRFCKAVVATAGGRAVDGVHIDTRWLSEADFRLAHHSAQRT